MASDALLDRLAGYERLVEVGVGTRPDAAAALAAAGCDVVATDVADVAHGLPETVRFVRDDVVSRVAAVPDRPGPYAGADAVYARRLPPELHRPARSVAGAVGADCLFTTLGGDPPAVPVETETLPSVALHRARPAPGAVRD